MEVWGKRPFGYFAESATCAHTARPLRDVWNYSDRPAQIRQRTRSYGVYRTIGLPRS